MLAAGTSDLPVAKEAQLTACYLGRPTELLSMSAWPACIGSWAASTCCDRPGSSSWLREWTALCQRGGGLVAAPVVAVPTSVGYGAAFEGLAALLTMLNACAPGVAVVNIDNGYGAGHLAAQIAAPLSPSQPEQHTPRLDRCLRRGRG